MQTVIAVLVTSPVMNQNTYATSLQAYHIIKLSLHVTNGCTTSY